MDLAKRVYYYMPDDKAVNQKNRGMFNCSEAMLRAINDKYNLNISEDAKVQMAAFGGGFFMGDACGLLVGGYAGLAHMYTPKTSPMANDKLKTVCREWYLRFNNNFDTVACNKMKPLTRGCSGHAMQAAKIFEKLVNDVGYQVGD